MILEATYKTYKLKLVWEFKSPTSSAIKLTEVINENDNDIFSICTSETKKRLIQLIKNDLN